MAPSGTVSRKSARFAASTVAMLVKLKKATNWAMTSRRKISPAMPAKVFTTMLIAAVRSFTVPAPLP